MLLLAAAGCRLRNFVACQAQRRRYRPLPAAASQAQLTALPCWLPGQPPATARVVSSTIKQACFFFSSIADAPNRAAGQAPPTKQFAAKFSMRAIQLLSGWHNSGPGTGQFSGCRCRSSYHLCRHQHCLRRRLQLLIVRIRAIRHHVTTAPGSIHHRTHHSSSSDTTAPANLLPDIPLQQPTPPPPDLVRFRAAARHHRRLVAAIPSPGTFDPGSLPAVHFAARLQCAAALFYFSSQSTTAAPPSPAPLQAAARFICRQYWQEQISVYCCTKQCCRLLSSFPANYCRQPLIIQAIIAQLHHNYYCRSAH